MIIYRCRQEIIKAPDTGRYIVRKGDYVQVINNAKYSGQYMAWTEENTGSAILPKGTKLLHTSDTKLTAFCEKETCFFTDDRGTGYIYLVTLLEDVHVEYYGYEEVRFEITPNNIQIQYMGYRGKSKLTDYVYKDFTLPINI
jgi:hypothetical protein